MNRAYLISNRTDARESDMDFSLGLDDQIILFNHTYPIKFEKIRLFENKTLMIRRTDRGYLGVKRARGTNMSFQRLVMIGGRDESGNIMEETRIPDACVIEEEDFLEGLDEKIAKKVAEYPRGKSFTTGFYGFLYASKYMPDHEVVLVGFTGESSVIGVEKWSGHSYEFEAEFYDTLGVKRHASGTGAGQGR